MKTDKINEKIQYIENYIKRLQETRILRTHGNLLIQHTLPLAMWIETLITRCYICKAAYKDFDDLSKAKEECSRFEYIV